MLRRLQKGDDSDTWSCKDRRKRMVMRMQVEMAVVHLKEKKMAVSRIGIMRKAKKMDFPSEENAT
jgi:hypothetical protein